MATAGRPSAGHGLTTGAAPFIEEAVARGDLFIRQPYELYSEENHRTWSRLLRRIRPRWQAYAHPKFLEGVASLVLPEERIPRLDDVNRFLAPLSGFVAKPVSGYVPAFLFFDCLRRREFPTTITIRDPERLDYLPEPDIFHDLAGHVPMHTRSRFADALVRFGEVAASASVVARSRGGDPRGLVELESIVRALARFFWFTIEFGLMTSHGELKVYGSGLLSSFEEIESAVKDAAVQRHPFQLEWVIHQSFEIHHAQPLLFVIESFDHLFAEVERLEEWMRAGKLSNVAPGEPAVSEADLASFLGLETVAAANG
ncbi:MAG: phenylalanine 4-monooxygenase [Thermoanaerobaculia bacterium]|nr:phenylalanine 4-monooxygenase [Thermoanaerobaculia bacterium]